MSKVEWISINDRFPNNGEYVLVVGVENIVAESCYSDKDFWHPYYGQEYTDRFTGITHWMPLPEPPKQICSHDFRPLGEPNMSTVKCIKCNQIRD